MGDATGVAAGLERHYRISDVEQLAGIHRATIYRAIAAQKFPKPYKIGHLSVWRHSELRQWAASLPQQV